MIEELKQHIYGYSLDGKPESAGTPTTEEIWEKINEIIRYLNEKENNDGNSTTNP
jgi:hypothetical protein